MLTYEQKRDLETVLKDYERALVYGEDEQAENAAVALDATMSAMAAEPGFLEYGDNEVLVALVGRIVDDARGSQQAAQMIQAATLFMLAIDSYGP
jgi:hypothetical protein